MDTVLAQVPVRYRELISQLLTSRGFGDPEIAGPFMAPDFARDTHDPFLLADIDKAVDRILRALEAGEKIGIYGDFDCDGIPGSVVLFDFFRKSGYPNLEVYIPHRHDEGYGFHQDAVDTLKKRGVTLIITVDVGIMAHEAVAYAQGKGIDVIVTDHHDLPDELPAAFAVINPKRAPYPFPNLCGAAVAWKLACAVLATGRSRLIKRFLDISDGWEKWLLDMVAIATIADLVPLVGENRVLAKYGLIVLRKTPRPGILALCRKTRADQKSLSEEDIGFLIGPRINAASRMDSPELAFKLLSADDPIDASRAADALEKLNNERKGVVASLVREAKKRVEERKLYESPVIVLGDPQWKPALLGLACSSIVEAYGKPVCVWGKSGSGVLKGSCRSNGVADISELLESVGDLLIERGGHAGAGGFAVSHEHVHSLHEEMSKAFARLDMKAGSTKADIATDASLKVEDATLDLLNALSQMSPFGMGNPQPVFSFADALISDARVFGKSQEHSEIVLRSEKGTMLKAIRFFTPLNSFTTMPKPGTRANVLGTLERDRFGSVERPRLRLIDIR